MTRRAKRPANAFKKKRRSLFAPRFSRAFGHGAEVPLMSSRKRCAPGRLICIYLYLAFSFFFSIPLYLCLCSIAVTVTALLPTRLCRLAVFLVKPTFSLTRLQGSVAKFPRLPHDFETARTPSMSLRGLFTVVKPIITSTHRSGTGEKTGDAPQQPSSTLSVHGRDRGHRG